MKLYVVKQGVSVTHPQELEHSLDTLKSSGFAEYVKKSREGKELTINCCNITPTQASGHLAYACEVIAQSVGLNPKEQVHYEPRKKLTISPALKAAIRDIFRN